jgi:hypothetical protein
VIKCGFEIVITRPSYKTKTAERAAEVFSLCKASIFTGPRLYQIRLHCKEEFGYTHAPMVTKRQLGVGISAIGLLFALGIFAVDLLGAGNEAGIGPLQRLALLVASALFILGLTLIPLGNRPA